MGDPVHVLLGVQAHIRYHAGEEDVIGAASLGHGDGLPLQVADRADSVGPKQLEAADVAPRQHDDLVPRFHWDKERPDEVHGDVDLAGSYRLREQFSTYLDVLCISEPLAW